MRKIELRIFPKDKEVLTTPARKVVTFDNSLERLAAKMLSIMYENNGIGLAAPQVGILKSVIVLYLSGRSCVLINPKITKYSEEWVSLTEGCLSFPNLFLEIKRPANIEVEYQDLRGIKKKLSAEGWLSRVIQHETDHLRGVLFIDSYIDESMKNFE